MTPISNQRNRLSELDGLRGVAAIWVGLYHFWGAIQKRDVDWVPELFEDFFEIGFFGVDIFFVLSGFVIMYSVSGTKIDRKFVPRFMLRRSIRIDPPYWCAIVIVIILMLLKGHFFRAEAVELPSVTSVIAHFFYLQDLLEFKAISSVFWTLCLEFQFYLFFSFIYYFYCKANHSWRKILGKCFVIVGLIFCFVSPIFRFSSMDLILPGTILPFAYEFILGVYAYFWIKGDVGNRVIFLAIALSAASTVLYKPLYYPLIPLFSVMFILLSSRTNIFFWMRSKIMLFLGRISYSFYLTHASIGWVSISLMMHISSRYEGEGVTAIIFLAGILTSIIFSTIFYKMIESPSMLVSKKFKLRVV